MKIALDKQAHFWAGMAIALAFALFFGPVIGLIASIVFGIGKEIVDSFGHGTPDKWDAAATALGGFVAYILYFINISVAV